MRWGRAPASPSSTALRLRAGAAPTDARAFALVGRRQAHADRARRLARASRARPARHGHRHHRTRACEDAFRPVLVSYDNTVDGGEPATYIVEHGRLRDALLAAAAGRPVDRPARRRAGRGLPGRRARGQRRSRARACAAQPCAPRCSSPPTGGASPLREAAGIGVVRWSYPQAGIVTTVRHERAAPGPRRAALPARPARSPSCR